MYKRFQVRRDSFLDCWVIFDWQTEQTRGTYSEYMAARSDAKRYEALFA